MESPGPNRPHSYGKHGPTVFLSIDFGFGVAAGFGAYFLSKESNALIGNHVALLLGQMALGIALLGIAVSLMTSFSSLLDTEYRLVIERVPNGVSGAFFPYKVVAAVAGAASIQGFIALFAWDIRSVLPFSTIELRSFALALAAALTVWAVVGTLQLVSLNAFHAIQKHALQAGIGEARKLARERIKKNVG